VNYKETTEFLFNKLTSFQLSGKSAYKPGLDNIIALDDSLGNPHKSFKSIHVAGTNGKGSVSHMLASILQEAGYKTGLFTSPHLRDFRERIRINGEMISEENVVDFVRKNIAVINRIQPSFFEISTAMAFDYFRNCGVEVAVIETGLGGRLDSTNILAPLVSVITNIGMDHTDLLGDSLEKIAFEKAGIIKNQIPVVIGRSQSETAHVFRKRAIDCKSEISFADQEFTCNYSMLTLDNKQSFNIAKNENILWPNLKTDLLGQYQIENSKTVLATLTFLENHLKISKDAVYNGFSDVMENTGLSGRWQVLCQSPLTVCDTGHNVDGISKVVEQLKNTAYKNLHFIFGVVNDKNIDGILNLLPKNAMYYFTKASIPRALDEKVLLEKALKFNLQGKSFPTVQEALEAAKNIAEIEDMIFIGGSTFVVAEVV